MEYTVLYSGSSGNCAYIKEKESILLVDAGVSGKKIKEGLAVHNIALEQVGGVLLTHEHSDHVTGLKQLIDRYQIPLYTNQKTYNAIPEKYRPQQITNINFVHEEFTNPEFSMSIKGLPISHDVVDGRFYIFETDKSKLVYLTDTGYVAEKYYASIQNADGYVIESNHEPELVLQSRYPWHIQQRILSDKGHLSNADCAILLQKIVGDRTKHITLAHLSEENNRADIAYNRITHAMQQINRAEIDVAIAEKSNIHKKAIII